MDEQFNSGKYDFYERVKVIFLETVKNSVSFPL